MVQVEAFEPEVPSIGQAVESFLAAKPLSVIAISYTYTLRRVAADLGENLPVDQISPQDVRETLEGRWGDASPATWNNRLTALGSFRRWILANGWTRTDLLAGIERRPLPRDETAAIRYEELHRLWTRRDIHVREKALWRNALRNSCPC